jgi:hypothetical protein
MSLLDRFRSWLGFEVRGFDQDIRTDTENAAKYIKQRTVLHVKTMHDDVEAFFDDMIAEQQRQRREDKPLTFEPVAVPATVALAAPAKQEPEVPATAIPSEVATTEPPAPEPEQAAPAENERRAAPKAKKKTASVKQKAEASAPPMPSEPPAPEQAGPSPEIMDDAALAALIQRDRLAGGKKKKA